MPYSKKCSICGNLFYPIDDRQKYCNPGCRMEAKRRSSKSHNGNWYNIEVRDLTLGDVNNILVEENITIEEFIENRTDYVIKYLYGGK